MEFIREMAGTATLEILEVPKSETPNSPDIKWIEGDYFVTGTGTYAKPSHPPAEEVEHADVFQFVNEYSPLDLLPPPRPDIVYDDAVHSMLTDRVREVLKGLLGLLNHEARRYYIPVSKIEISGFVDPEENRREIVVTQWVLVPAETALDYWDMLGFRVEDWIKLLPSQLQRIASERITIEVYWDDDGTVF